MLRRSMAESAGVAGSAVAAPLAGLRTAAARPRHCGPSAFSQSSMPRCPSAADRRSLSCSAKAMAAAASPGASSSHHKSDAARMTASKASSAPTRSSHPGGGPSAADDAPLYPSSRAHLSPARLPALFAHSAPKPRATPARQGEQAAADRLLQSETPLDAEEDSAWAGQLSEDSAGPSSASHSRAQQGNHGASAPPAHGICQAARQLRASIAHRQGTDGAERSIDASSSSSVPTDASLSEHAIPPPSMFYSLLRHAPPAATPLVFDDYCAFHKSDTHALNLLLRRHVAVEDCDAVHHASASLASASVDGAGEGIDAPSAALLSPSWSASWTPATWALMLKHASTGSRRNPEHLLALLGAVPAQLLPRLLTPQLQYDAISTLAGMREVRLAVELAVWMQGRAENTGSIAHRGQIWDLVLRAGAEERWYPAVKRGYEGASQSGRLPALDSDLLLSVLATCARAGDPLLAETILEQRLAGQAPSQLHLEALFIAHCNAHSFEGALRLLGKLDDLDRRGRSEQMHRPLVTRLVKSAGKSDLLWNAAHAAWRRVGTDAGPDGGVTTAGMNALLFAALSLDRPADAQALYAKRGKLRARRQQASASSQSDKDAPASLPGAQQTVQPNVQTFHALLWCCLRTGDSERGRALLKELAEQRPVIVGNVATYELAVELLCLTDKYDDAFGYMAEATRRGISVSRRTLELLRDTCAQHGDRREAELEDQLEERARRRN